MQVGMGKVGFHPAAFQLKERLLKRSWFLSDLVGPAASDVLPLVGLAHGPMC